MEMKKTISIFLFILISSISFSQEKQKIEVHNKNFKSSFVYSIESKTKSSFTVNISSKRDKKKVITKIHEKIIGKKFFKVDVSTLKKGSYYFKILDNKLKVVFEKKIKKL